MRLALLNRNNHKTPFHSSRYLLGKLFLEVLVSHSYTKEALDWLSNKKKNCRVLIAKKDVIQKQQSTQEGSLVIRSIFGGLLVQTPDSKGKLHLLDSYQSV